MVHSTLAVSLLAAASAVFAVGGPEVEKTEAKAIPGAYIVEFDENANARQFRTQAEPEYETRMDLNFELFKGVSIQLSDVDSAEEAAAQLASLPSVKKIWPVRLHAPPDMNFLDLAEPGHAGLGHPEGLHRRSDNGTRKGDAPLRMTQIDKLHGMGISGEGVTIAVIDTGIDYTHPALGGCFGEGCLVVRGYDLTGDDYDGLETKPVPDDDPYDGCMGHGTHVAGIIAAQANAYMTGAAPGVQLAAYRVLGCTGSATDDVLIAAFNMAYEEGADVITASLGSPSGWADDIWADVASRIVAAGVPVTISAGNSGLGLFDGKAPSSGRDVTGVASFDSVEIPSLLYNGSYTVDGGREKQFLFKNNKPAGFDDVERELWVTSYDVTNDEDSCAPLPDDTPDLGDFTVLIRRSDSCDLFTQALNLVDKGAKFFILYNNQDGIESFFLDGSGLTAGAMVTREQGEAWVRTLKSGSTVKVRFPVDERSVRQYVPFENPETGGMVSEYTSWGPNYDMNLKPQVGAPGGYILSLFPVKLGSYVTMSGTSMAAPLVAASFALIKQARGMDKLDPTIIEGILSSTSKAQVIQYWGPRQDWLAPPAQQGAGLVQVLDAATTPAYLLPSSLGFNDTDNFAGTLNLTIFNDGDDEATYEVAHVPTRTLYSLKENQLEPYNWNISANSEEYAELEFSTSKVTIGPGASAVVAVTATPPSGLDPKRYPYWSGYITVNGTDGAALSVPYHGIVGSLYEATVMHKDGRGTYISDTFDGNDEPAPANSSFLLPYPGEWPEDALQHLPALSTMLYWGTPEMRVDVVPLSSCPANSTLKPTKRTIDGQKSLGNIRWYPKYFTQRAYLLETWFGQMEDNETFAPPGRYKLVVQVLRMFGNASNIDDWTINETLPFFIDYREKTEPEGSQ